MCGNPPSRNHQCSSRASRRGIAQAALINPMWLNAWGKFPGLRRSSARPPPQASPDHWRRRLPYQRCPPGPAEFRHQAWRARRVRKKLPSAPLDPILAAVAIDQPAIIHEPALDRLNRPTHPGIIRRQEANQGNSKGGRIRLQLKTERLGESTASSDHPCWIACGSRRERRSRRAIAPSPEADRRGRSPGRGQPNTSASNRGNVCAGLGSPNPMILFRPTGRRSIDHHRAEPSIQKVEDIRLIAEQIDSPENLPVNVELCSGPTLRYPREPAAAAPSGEMRRARVR